ncbi:hypothetical protein O5Q10_004591 [Salmonella enterica]|nr:hypothetical protein [Salmonella enterica]
MINKYLQQPDTLATDKLSKELDTTLISDKPSLLVLNAVSVPVEHNELAQRLEGFLLTKGEPTVLRVVDEFPPFDQDALRQIALMRDGR